MFRLRRVPLRLGLVTTTALSIPLAAFGAPVLIDGGGGFNPVNHVTGSVSLSDSIYSNFVTRGGAGSGGGGGFGGVFFVDAGGSLTLDSVSFNTNTAIGGQGGADPARRIGAAAVALSEIRVAVAESSDIGVRAAIDPADNGFTALTLNFANPLITPGMRVTLPGVAAPVEVASVSGSTVTLAARVIAPASQIRTLATQSGSATSATTLSFDKDAADFRALRAGAYVKGTGVAAGTYVESIDYDAGVVTLSAPLGAGVASGASIQMIDVTRFDATPVVATGGSSITLNAANRQLQAGMFVAGAGIPSGARIASISGDGRTITLDQALTGAVSEFEAVASPGEAGGAIVRLPAPDARFTVGMSIAGEGVPAGARIVAVNGGELTLDAPLTATPGSITASPIQSATFDGVATTITMADAALLNGITPGMLLTGGGAPSGAVVQSVSGNTVTVSGDLSGVASFTAASALTQGGAMNGVAPTGASGTNGGAGRNGVTGFIDTEGAPGTRGIAGGDGAGGVGGAGGEGGAGSDGRGTPGFLIGELAFNVIMLAFDLKKASAASATFPPNVALSAVHALQATMSAKDVAKSAANLAAWYIALGEGGVARGGHGGVGGAGGDGAAFFGGGAGGAGGTGGDAGSSSSAGGDGGGGGAGGDGGCGAGGAIAGAPGAGGRGGFGGGRGADGEGRGGGGGSGFGGAIFVRDGGTLILQGDAVFGDNDVIGGSGGPGGVAGAAAGSDLFMMRGSNVVIAPGGGRTIVFNGSIADDSRASFEEAPNGVGAGAGLTTGAGLTLFNGVNTYTGETRIVGGALQAMDGIGVHRNSNINFAGSGQLSADTAGVLQMNGTFTRQVGTLSNRVQWTGSGGFAAVGGALTVNLGGTAARQTFTWNSGGFVPAGETLVFGSAHADSEVEFRSNIDLGGGFERIAVMDNPASGADFARITGVIANGGLTVGAPGYAGRLVLEGQNTFAGGLTVAGGLVEIAGSGALADAGAVTVASGAALILGAADTIGALATSGFTQITADIVAASVDNDGILRMLADVEATGFTNDGDLLVEGARRLTTAGFSGSGDAALAAGAVLTLDQSGASTYAGALLGAGGFVKTGAGALTLTGANTHAGGTTVAGGTLDTTGGGLLADGGAVHIAAGATFRAGTADVIGALSVDGAAFVDASLDAAGFSGGGAVTVAHGAMFTSRQAQDATFSGAFSGPGAFTLDGPGALTVTGVFSQQGEMAILSGRLATSGAADLSDAAAIRVGGAAHLDFGAADTVGALSVADNGRLTVGLDVTATGGAQIGGAVVDGAATLTAPTYALTGATISANLGSGLLTSNGSTFLSGDVGAETVRVVSGVLTLLAPDILNHAAMLTVFDTATLALLGGSQTVRTLDGSGTVELYGNDLNITDGGNFSGRFLGAGAVQVDTGVLTPSDDIVAPDSPFTVNDTAIAQINSGVNLDVREVNVGGALNVAGRVEAQSFNVMGTGMLTVASGGSLQSVGHGTIAGGLRLDAGSTLSGAGFTVGGAGAWIGGNGVITGATTVANGGRVRPGASPGILTNVGDLTLGGVLEVEIAGRAGAGVLPDGHDRLDVTGVLTLAPGSQLDIVRDNVITTFEPLLGDRFDVFQVAPGSLEGVFDTVTSEFDNGVVLNLSTGEVVGTGGTPGQPLTATLGATSNERRAIAGLLAGSAGGVEQYHGGALIANALEARATSAAAASAVFRSASPEGYAGLVDYGLHAMRFKLDSVRRADTRPMGALGAFVAGDLMRLGRSASDDDAGYVLTSGGAIFGLEAGFGQGAARVFVGLDAGGVSTSRIDADGTGWVLGGVATFTPADAELLTFSLAAGYGDVSMEGSRDTFSGRSSFDDVASRAFVATAEVAWRAYETESFILTPSVGFSIGSASASAFRETNLQTFEALAVDEQDAVRSAIEIGLGGDWRLGDATRLRADGRVAYDVSDSSRTVSASLVDDPGAFSVVAPGLGALSSTLSLGLDYAPTESTRIRVGGSLGVSDESAVSSGFSLQAEVRF
jgi:autotransporter-associated beta strand protein